MAYSTVSDGDLLQIYGYTMGGATCNVQNFKVYGKLVNFEDTAGY